MKLKIGNNEYEIKELTAQESMDALNRVIKNPESLKNLTQNDYNKIMIEAATTVNGNPLKIDFAKIPQKTWLKLLLFHEQLNSMSDEEARFLLQSCGLKPQQFIQL